ncbi:MAG: MBL fold metallo-hydrolase [Bacteroidales bacterium]|jgi:glyoxylase-like metal-dependent hydrolase (beta-lactamase superfamily II)|nr:MBL fold metallo-hydrolase [Bacteroidales bacterium]
MITTKKFTFNPVSVNTYVVYDETGECVIIDPGCYRSDEEQELSDFISGQGLTPVKMLNTHGHLDHIFGVEYCRRQYGIPFLLHENDIDLVRHSVQQGYLFNIPTGVVGDPDGLLREGEPLTFGASSLQVLHVPGHSPGSVCFYDATAKQLFSGDVLFFGSIGRTDFIYGDLRQLLDGIASKLLSLPDDTAVWAGHGAETSIRFERRNNPFLKA